MKYMWYEFVYGDSVDVFRSGRGLFWTIVQAFAFRVWRKEWNALEYMIYILVFDKIRIGDSRARVGHITV
jgi:hypothetical protein